MLQRWHDLCFAHWPLPPNSVRPLVPRSFELDLFEGAAWVGIIPFWMSGVRVRCLPSVPTASTFPELNVRTYVTCNGKPGVYFFSLDAASRLAVEAARRWFRLPYFHASMRREEHAGEIHYRSRRKEPPNAELEMRYAPAGPVFDTRPGSLEHFLTARYALFNHGKRGETLTTEIHHQPWPLQVARASLATNTMAAASGIELPASPPLLHFSKVLEVLFWSPRLVR